MEDITKELKKKFNIDQMTQEKEAEISGIVSQLDAFKQDIDESQAKAANFQAQKNALEEEKQDLASTLKKNKAELKKKKEILKEVEKLGN